MADETSSILRTGLVGAVLSGRYRLESKLGSGGMSTVYLARDETLERWVAVKVLHREISDQPDQLERFRREARAVAQLSHPNVVAVIDAGEDGGYPYIVFEYVPGETLKARIDSVGRLPLDEAAAYAIEIGRGLAAAHAQKLIHRDVKPQNVLIDAEGRAKVTDFGIARSLESDGLTKTGRVLGTTDYVSPEQAMGHDVDARSDIYSLGVLLYEMLTGEPPFKAETVVGVAMKHVNEPMPDTQVHRSDASAALARVVENATSKDPGKRYRNMNEMLAELEAALEVEVARSGTASGEATSVLDSVPPERRKLLPSRRVSIAGILLVLAATAAALIVAALTGGGGHTASNGGSGGGGGVPSGAPIHIQSARAFDPEGTGGEHNSDAPNVVDGDPVTSWSTETYDAGPALKDSNKSGVGLILDVGKPTPARTMIIDTPHSGWAATIYGAAAGPPSDAPGAGSGWTVLSGSTSTDINNTTQTIELNQETADRYYLVWITSLAGAPGDYSVEINSVKLTS
jgi:eukaryotic-like serine/threonine-protein kinase